MSDKIEKSEPLITKDGPAPEAEPKEFGVEDVKKYFVNQPDFNEPGLTEISDNVSDGEFFKKVTTGKDQKNSAYDLAVQDVVQYKALENQYRGKDKQVEADYYKTKSEDAAKVVEFLHKLLIEKKKGDFDEIDAEKVVEAVKKDLKRGSGGDTEIGPVESPIVTKEVLPNPSSDENLDFEKARKELEKAYGSPSIDTISEGVSRPVTVETAVSGGLEASPSTPASPEAPEEKPADKKPDAGKPSPSDLAREAFKKAPDATPVAPEEKPAAPETRPAPVVPEAVPVTPPVVEKPPVVAVDNVAEVQEPEMDMVKNMRRDVLEGAEERVISEYEKSGDLSKQSRAVLDSEINLDIKNVHRQFTLLWAQEEAKSDGEFRDLVKGLDNDAKFRLIWGDEKMRQRALADMEKDKDYLDRLGLRADLSADLQKDRVPIETQQLLVNFCAKNAKRLEAEIGALPAGDKKREEIQKRIDGLLNTQKDLVEGIKGGKKLEEIAEEELRATGNAGITVSKEEYVKAIVVDAHVDRAAKAKKEKQVDDAKKRITDYWDSMPESEKKKYRERNCLDGQAFLQCVLDDTKGQARAENRGMLTDNVVFALWSAGYETHKIKWGWFRHKATMPLLNGGSETKSGDEFYNLIKNIEAENNKKTREDARKEQSKISEDAYDLEKKQHSEKVREIVLREMNGVANFSRERIEGLYENVKNRLVAEYLEGIERKERGAEDMKDLKEKVVKGKRVDFTKVLGDIYNRRPRGFKKLDGEDLAKESKVLSKFLGDYGVRVGAGQLQGIINLEEYKKAVKGKKSFLDYMLDLIIKQPWAGASKKKAA